MHRAALAWLQRRPHTARPCGGGTALENWLPGHRTSRSGTWGADGRRGRHRRRCGCFVNRARPGLRHDGARRCGCHQSGRCWRGGYWFDRSCCRHGRRGRCLQIGCKRNFHRFRRRRGHFRRRWRWHGKGRTRSRSLRRDHPRRRRCWRYGGTRGGSRRCRSFRHRLEFHWRNRRLGHGRRRDRSLFLVESLQYIAGTGNVGEVDLRLDPIALATGSGLGTRPVTLALLAEMGAHFFRFVAFERTGMSLLGGNAGRAQGIQDRLALNFQFSCQIVDSNLAHPPLHSS